MSNNKKKIILPVITILLMIIGVIGVTYAFFNYTRTGLANTIRVGRIYFNHEQGNTITLENIFPISSEQAQNDTVNAKTLSINVIGDTDYDGGIEYLVTLDQVNNNQNVPITLEVSVSGTGLATNETGDYYTNRESYETSKYKIEYNNILQNGRHILVGYIAPNTTKGTIEGIEGTITIKAYIDSSKVLISDTYPEGTVTIDGVEYYNGTPTTNKKVLTTEEWNSITGSNTLSFKIKVEAREGIWVEKESTPASCFAFSTPVAKYLRNPNMDINACVSKFTEIFDIENNPLQEGETLESYCNGTGTIYEATLQEMLDMGTPESIANELETSGIIINLGYYTTEITDYDVSCGSDVIIPSKINSEIVIYTRNPNMDINTCISKFIEWGWNVDSENGETLEAFCNGTGTDWGETLQEELDYGAFSSTDLTELETVGIITSNSTPVQANITIIDANSFENKGLTSVTIPNSVTTIGNNAFRGNQLTNVEIPNSVTNDLCEEEVFDSTVTIYKNGSQFMCPTKASCFTTSISNGNVTITDYDKNCGNKVIIPSTIDGNRVTTIGDSAFIGKDLTNIVIPNGVTLIGVQAFWGNQLTNVDIPNSVTEIGLGAFYDNRLTSVTVPNSVIERPWDDYNKCHYFNVGVNVTWNNQSNVCEEHNFG